jgi:FlaA1/EpsC-like NDP-sugar epimerase
VVTLPHSQPSLNEDVPGLKMPSLEDVLPVEDCRIKVEGLREVVEGKTYLLNGSGDAFGLETCRLILQLGCRRLIIVERFETYLSELLNTLYKEFDSRLIIPCLIEGPYDKEIQRIVERHRPDVIIHASLRKFPRYDSVDISNFERTNYQQTFAVAKASVQNGCGMFVLVSSREAENKEGLLGETMRVAETSLKHFFKETPTRFAVARLCDIIDNNRGLIAQLENRIRKGERISISSHDSTTYIISSKSAAAFVVEVIWQRERNAISEPVNVCSYSTPISLIDITSRISMLYSINVWDENKIVFKEEPNASMPSLSLPDANARVSADTDPEMPPKLSKEEIHKEFKAFVDNFEETWENRSINREASRLLVLSECEDCMMN